MRRQSPTPRGCGLGPGSDTFGRGDVAEADLGRLVPVLVGALAPAAGSPGGRPAAGCHVLGHVELGWLCAGPRKHGWTRILAGCEVRERAQRLHEPSRTQRPLGEEEGAETEKRACLAARRQRDVAGCPPPAR